MKNKISADKISKEYLEDLIKNHSPENIQLAYRLPSDLSNNEKDIERLAIDVSAFANTLGGKIIFGIEQKRHRADKFCFMNEKIHSSEFLMNTLNVKIFKNIEALNIYPVFFDDEMQNSIIVIDIPESRNSPHMAPDKRFYKRYNFKSIPLEEYEVSHLYNKLNRIILEYVGTLNTNGIPTLSNGKFQSVLFLPRFLIRNISHLVEKNYKFEIAIPTALCDENYYALNSYFVRHEDIYSVFSIPNKSPLFQNEVFSITEAKLIVNRENLEYYSKGKIIINLYFSDGVKYSEFNISDILRYNNAILKVNDFA